MTHANGSSTKPIAGGEATWTGLPLGPFAIEEDIPVQFGEPIVFCGWTAIHEAIVYDAFSQLLPSAGGLVERETAIPGSFHFCYWFNVQGASGSFADAGSLTSTLLTRKWTCPDGTSRALDRDELVRQCQLMLTPVEFTLANPDGAETWTTSGGFAEWAGLPLGEFTLEEAIPAGYGAPVVYCGWYAEYGGFIYDDFPYLVPSLGGDLRSQHPLPLPCLQRRSGDRRCSGESSRTGGSLLPGRGEGVPARFDTNFHWMDVFQSCTIPIEGVEFTFTDASGSSTQPLTGLWVQWDQETVVSVYNCNGEPSLPGETPEMNPNTGVTPASRDGDRLQP